MGGSLDVYGSWIAMVNWCQQIDTTFKLSQELIEDKVVFQVYPQPIATNEALNIHVSAKGRMEMYNFLGQKKGEWQLEMGNNEVNSGLFSGVYTLVFTTDEKKIKKIQILVD
jgi:hypothetical protein